MLALAIAEDRVGGFNFGDLLPGASSPSEAPANGPAYPPSGRYTYDAASGTFCYEEYHPFGTSAYRAVDSTIQVSAKRYRYAAAERDEETGLDHMGLRYYAPWLGRWTSADPIGLGDGVNRYAYVHGNPVSMRDPGGTEASVPDLTEEDRAAIFADLERTKQEFLAAEAGSADAETLLETVNLLREQLGITAPGTGAEGSFVERAANDPGRVHDWDEFGQELVEARDELGRDVAVGAARVMSEATLVGRALSAYEAGQELNEALEAYQADPSPENEARVQAAGVGLATSLAPTPGKIAGPLGKRKIKPGKPSTGTTAAPQPASTRVTGPTDANAQISPLRIEPAAVGKTASNVPKSVPESGLGPSGKPKRHFVVHKSRKEALEASGQPSGTKPEFHERPTSRGQRKHFHEKGDRSIHHGFGKAKRRKR